MKPLDQSIIIGDMYRLLYTQYFTPTFNNSVTSYEDSCTKREHYVIPVLRGKKLTLIVWLKVS